MQTQLSTSDGAYAGLAAKIQIIRGYFPQSIKYPAVRSFVEKASMGKLGRPSLRALFTVLRTHFRYLPDPVGFELIKAPWAMIQEIGSLGYTTGDCDDAASLAYTLLHLVGISAKLAVGWYGGQDPQHIWTQVPLKDGKVVDFDLCAPTLGQTKGGQSEVKTYA